MQQFQFIDLVFLGIVVLLLVGRLRSVLGTRSERGEKSSPAKSKIVDISEYRTLKNEEEDGFREDFDENMTEKDSEIMATVRSIAKKYPDFNLSDFLHKAARAFEYIAQAFAAGKKEDLQPLLSRDIYKRFEKVIDNRKARGETAEFSLIGFKNVKLVGAGEIGNMAEMTVEFETEQTNIVKNAAGDIILGDPTYIETVTDVWTLRKEMNAESPVWVLAATHHKPAEA